MYELNETEIEAVAGCMGSRGRIGQPIDPCSQGIVGGGIGGAIAGIPGGFWGIAFGYLGGTIGGAIASCRISSPKQ